MKLLILILLLLSGCTQGKPLPNTYYLQEGVVQCAHRDISNCGVWLSKCTNGKTYRCQQNVSFEE